MTTLHCPTALRSQWPALATAWRAQYPMIFDEDDLRQTRKQGPKHFVEWFTAIHIFHRDGVCSLVEKYGYANHERKNRIVEELLPEKVAGVVRTWRTKTGAQPPDLLVYSPTEPSRFWFVEVKGPRDRMRPKQAASHRRLTRELGVRVEIVKIKFI